MKLWLILILFNQAAMSSAHSRCGSDYGERPCQFVPAKPGHTPSCASSGSTFCESIHGYPDSVVKKLLTSTKIEDQFVIDETQSDFKPKILKFEKETPKNYPFIRNFRGYDTTHQFYGKYDSSGSSQEPDFYPPFHGYGDHHFRKYDANNDFIKSISPRGKRQANANNEELCEIRTNFINPQAALNTQGNWMYVVQQTGAATQLVKTEICTSTRCSNLCQLPNNYVSRCEQKYVQKRLIALDASGERLYSDTFWFPSCCACTLSVSSK